MSTKKTQTPVIHHSGKINLNPGEYCIWETANGTSSVLQLANQSSANEVHLAITGAPDSGIIVSVNNESHSGGLNGFYKIPANRPDYRIYATGDFKGQKITINNMTSSQKPAKLDVTAQTNT